MIAVADPNEGLFRG